MVFPETAYSTSRKLNSKSLDSVRVTIYLTRSLKIIYHSQRKLFNPDLLIGVNPVDV